MTILDVYEDGTVRVAVEAPTNIAVSRDDISVEEHLDYQRLRERRHQRGR